VFLEEWLTPLPHDHVPCTVYDVHDHHNLHNVSEFSRCELLPKDASSVQKEELAWNIQPRETEDKVLKLKALFDSVGFVVWNSFAHNCFDVGSVLEPIMLRVCFQVSDHTINPLGDKKIFGFWISICGHYIIIKDFI
jgi:hypothetical protein